MKNFSIKIGLYLISLCFLWVLLLINKIEIPFCLYEPCTFIGLRELLGRNNLPAISLFFIILALIAYLVFRFKYEKGAPDLPRRIESLEDLQFENVSFLITYIVPLLCFDLDFDLGKNRNLLMLFMVLGLIGWIFVKTNAFYTNPTLAAFGYRIYRLRTKESEPFIAIVRGPLKIGDNIFPRHIEQNIYYVSKELAK